jgi:hypothetical protein
LINAVVLKKWPQMIQANGDQAVTFAIEAYQADDTNDAICHLVGIVVSQALSGITKILKWGCGKWRI